MQDSSLQALLGDSQPSLIPESFMTMLTVSFIVLNVLGILFLIFYVLGMVRKWRVQTAVLEMRKDLAEIKAQLNASAAPTQKFDPIVEPATENKVIAQADPEDSSEAQPNDKA